MKYKISEGSENNIISYNLIIENFSYLYEDNYDNIIINMIREDKLFKLINFPDSIINIIIDTIINDGDYNYLKEELINNNCILYSLVINIVNTYKIKYDRLCKLKDATDIVIECNKDNLIRGLELAKRLNKKTVIEGSSIHLSEYREILSSYDIEVFDNYDISIYYQEHNSEISIKSLFDTAVTIDNISKEIDKYNLSPFEKIIYVYDKVKSHTYKDSSYDNYVSRDLDKVVKGKYIVCVGFSNLFNAILRNLGINALPFVSTINKHQCSLVYIKDDKYKIDGVYVFDPTKDSRTSSNYIDNYTYFGMTINLSERYHPTDINKYIGLSFNEILKLYDINSSREFKDNLDITNEIEDLFNLINEEYKEFEELIYSGYSSVSRKKLLEMYRNFITKYNKEEISPSVFMSALYNTRIIEYYNGFIDTISLEDIREASRYRSFIHKRNSTDNIEKVDKLIELIDYGIELEDTLDNVYEEIETNIERNNLNIRLLKVLRNRY